ncbi:MAG: hypothetical protein ACFFCS_22355, partial [Candidatus Hodarchaeota archaeon]
EVSSLNLIMDIPVSMIPEYVGNLLEKVDVLIDDEVVISIDTPEAAAQCRVEINGKEYSFDNLQDAGTIPTNTMMIWKFPNVKGIKVGETHKFTLKIKIPEYPVDLSLEREVMG